jgi:hypothetical protein
MTALTFVAGDMLYRGTAGLAGELGKTPLMHAIALTWSMRTISSRPLSEFSLP